MNKKSKGTIVAKVKLGTVVAITNDEHCFLVMLRLKVFQ
jgi:hypothetical protein